jgi:hypothetical protein
MTSDQVFAFVMIFVCGVMVGLLLAMHVLNSTRK